MQHQTSPGDIINVGANEQISLVVDINVVQRDEDRRILPELNILEFDSPALCERWLVRGTNIHRVKRCGKDMLAGFWISGPASLRGVTDCVSLRLHLERDPPHIDVSGSSSEAPVVVLVKIDVVEEYDDLGRGDERALKVDAHRGGVATVAHVLTSKELHVARSKGEHMSRAAVESAIVSGCDMAVSAGLGDVLQHRLHADVTLTSDIHPAEAVREAGRGDEWTRKLQGSRCISCRLVGRTDVLGVKFGEDGHDWEEQFRAS